MGGYLAATLSDLKGSSNNDLVIAYVGLIVPPDREPNIKKASDRHRTHRAQTSTTGNGATS